MNENQTVQSIDRAMMLLEELARHVDGCGVTHLSKLTGLHKSTVHRLLYTLMTKEYVMKDSETDKYYLGMKILYLGSSILDRLDVRKIAKPFAEELCHNSDEVVHLSILDNGEAVYIDKFESPNKSIRMYSQIGKRVPLHCTGVGKVLMAWLPEKEIEYILNSKGMKAFTKNTITDIKIMKKHLEEIKNKGYATDEIEHEEGIRCVAAPIFDLRGKVVAAISVSGPVLHVTKERMPELIEEVLKTSRAISHQLGYNKKI